MKKFVAKLEDVPEALRGEYEKDGDGFRLKVEGEDDGPAALKGALQKERKAREDAEREVKRLLKDFEGVDPEKAREALSRIQELSDRKLIDEGKIEELIRTRTERMAADHKSQTDAAQKRIEALTSDLGVANDRLSGLLVDGSIKDAAVKARVRPSLLQALIRVARSGDVDGIKWILRDGEPTPVVGDAVKFGKDAAHPMTPTEYVDLVRAKVADFFEPSTGAGGRPDQGGSGPGGQFVLSAEEARDVSRYKAVKAAAEKAGASVQIVN